MPAKRRTCHHGAVSFLIAFAMLFGFSACSDDATCKTSADCAASQICATRGQGPLHCLDSCSPDGTCRAGFSCEIVGSAECFACDVVIQACVVAPPQPPKF